MVMLDVDGQGLVFTHGRHAVQNVLFAVFVQDPAFQFTEDHEVFHIQNRRTLGDELADAVDMESDIHHAVFVLHFPQRIVFEVNGGDAAPEGDGRQQAGFLFQPDARCKHPGRWTGSGSD